MPAIGNGWGAGSACIGEADMKYIASVEEREYLIEILDEHHVAVDGAVYEIDFVPVNSQPVYSLIVNGESFDAHVFPDEEVWQVHFQGNTYSVQVEDEREKRLRTALNGAALERREFHLKAPMPGMVISVAVQSGQTVKKGDVLLILESMKMQNELKSPRDGIVGRVRVAAGDRVEKKDTLLSVI
jgi:biotin carboxyl carrier protein